MTEIGNQDLPEVDIADLRLHHAAKIHRQQTPVNGRRFTAAEKGKCPATPIKTDGSYVKPERELYADFITSTVVRSNERQGGYETKVGPYYNKDDENSSTGAGEDNYLQRKHHNSFVVPEDDPSGKDGAVKKYTDNGMFGSVLNFTKKFKSKKKNKPNDLEAQVAEPKKDEDCCGTHNPKNLDDEGWYGATKPTLTHISTWNSAASSVGRRPYSLPPDLESSTSEDEKPAEIEPKIKYSTNFYGPLRPHADSGASLTPYNNEIERELELERKLTKPKVKARRHRVSLAAPHEQKQQEQAVAAAVEARKYDSDEFTPEDLREPDIDPGHPQRPYIHRSSFDSVQIPWDYDPDENGGVDRVIMNTRNHSCRYRKARLDKDTENYFKDDEGNGSDNESVWTDALPDDLKELRAADDDMPKLPYYNDRRPPSFSALVALAKKKRPQSINSCEVIGDQSDDQAQIEDSEDIELFELTKGQVNSRGQRKEEAKAKTQEHDPSPLERFHAARKAAGRRDSVDTVWELGRLSGDVRYATPMASRPQDYGHGAGGYHPRFAIYEDAAHRGGVGYLPPMPPTVPPAVHLPGVIRGSCELERRPTKMRGGFGRHLPEDHPRVLEAAALGEAEGTTVPAGMKAVRGPGGSILFRPMKTVEEIKARGLRENFIWGVVWVFLACVFMGVGWGAWLRSQDRQKARRGGN